MAQKRKLSTRRATLATTSVLCLTALGMAGSFGLEGVGPEGFGPATANAQESPTVLKNGHIDAFNVSADDQGLVLQLKEDATGQHVKREPSSVELCVTEKAWEKVTAKVDFIGQGSYYLPQGSNGKQTIWPGWDTSDVRGSGAEAVDIHIASLQGPGEVYLWQNGNLGEREPVTGNYQVQSGAKISVPYPAHAHANWAFTKPGRYTMQVQAKADNGATSAAKNYYWTVEGDGVSCGEGIGRHPKPPSSGDSNPGADDVSGGIGNNGETGNNQNGGAAGNGGLSGKTPGTGSRSASSAGASTNGPSRGTPTRGTSTKGGGGIVQGVSSAKGSAPQCKKGEPALRARIKDDRQSPPTWRSPSSLVFGLGGAAKAEVPQALGPINRGTVWMIGSTQQNGVPWLGANTMHPDLLAQTTGDVAFSLTSFSGPGNMFVYEQGNLGQIVGTKWFQASGGQASGSHTVPRNSHVHPNWVFDKPGTYKVGITQTAVLKTGKKVSAPAVLTFNVGGAGNANAGHFDFGADVTTSGNCDGGTGAAGATGGMGGAGADGLGAAGSGADGAGSGANSLANTGMTSGTLSLLVVGLGITALGAGIVYYLRSSQAMLRVYARR
ncbi:TIGR03773 family transporter-associated surface protein [Corynebacterium auriscanis]|uniref:TIGR03773 family transporter-associated surface protein n=1 Tax=Corynebacterium auriscanis TaxID=99807 RepID=UPI0022452591|nr:TIGR03773 family transporter-associated surface protein [Corynebacterium auriscanis]MCX2162721.1 TIGR03773 family transporter-associated surface protein [Corynebacterium auriscanis]